jgi:hypothetical protein
VETEARFQVTANLRRGDILDRAISSFQSYRLQPGQTMIRQISASRSIIIRESAVTDTGRSQPLQRRAEGHVSSAA